MTNFKANPKLFFALLFLLCLQIFMPVTLWADSTIELIRAAKTGDLDKVYEYLAGDADINGRDGNGRTALIQAATSEKSNSYQIIELLLDAGSDINAADKKGNTALILAAGHGNSPMIQLLLSKGANSELKNNSGYTAMDKAEEKNKYGAIKILKLSGKFTVALALFIDIRNRAIDSQQFQKAATKAFNRRKWKITKTGSNVVEASLNRRSIMYKTRFILEKNHVVIRYDYGFGGNNFKYLSNLKVDFLRNIK